MRARITIGAPHEFELSELADMYRLRAKVFGERMGWEVAILAGMEIDCYDAFSPHYMLVRNEKNVLCGCWRLLPTQGPYMLKDTFAQLLHGRPAPCSPHIWELSRFLIASNEKSGYGFTNLVLETMREASLFAERINISHYVTVTTTAVERLLKKTGIDICRFGPPLRIGAENAVALTIDLGKQTRLALFGQVAEIA